MTSSEVSAKANSSNGRGDSFSSTCTEPNDGGAARSGAVEAGRGFAGAPAGGKDMDDALYTELWHACAGPLVTVPRQGGGIHESVLQPGDAAVRPPTKDPLPGNQRPLEGMQMSAFHRWSSTETCAAKWLERLCQL